MTWRYATVCGLGLGSLEGRECRGIAIPASLLNMFAAAAAAAGHTGTCHQLVTAPDKGGGVKELDISLYISATFSIIKKPIFPKINKIKRMSSLSLQENSTSTDDMTASTARDEWNELNCVSGAQCPVSGRPVWPVWTLLTCLMLTTRFSRLSHITQDGHTNQNNSS